MSPRCPEGERISALALDALPAEEASQVEVHALGCAECRRDLDDLRCAVKAFGAWPADALAPRASLRERLGERMGFTPSKGGWHEPDWSEVAPGVFCKVLANDLARQRVSMLVRLMPKTRYPAHTHAGVEELHLLDGELWIDERRLRPGDYNRAEPHTSDTHVWSETGCTCVLITSMNDVLR